MKNIIYLALITTILISSCSKGESGSATNPPGTTTGITQGKGGSYARFAIQNNRLYAVAKNGINTFDISSSNKITLSSFVNTGFGLQTIFPYNNYLFLGSQTGFYVYDLSDVDHPLYKTMISHIRSCDPVAIEGDYAFLTLHTGEVNKIASSSQSSCSKGVNQLQVYNVKNINNVTFLKSYPMSQPLGLGVDSPLLFVCDTGLKVFNMSDPMDLKTVATFPVVSTFDVIPNKNILILTSGEGILQYDYSDPKNIKLISKIPVQ